MTTRPDAFFREAFERVSLGVVLVDAQGQIAEANRCFEALFGYEPGALVGRAIETVIPEGAAHAAHRARFAEQPRARVMGNGRALEGVRRDGRRVPVEVGLAPLREGDTTWVLATVTDLSERARALAEKDTLLRELHHRAKNHLQLVESLLELASENPGRETLAECRARVRAISMVHERLYQGEVFAQMQLGEYLRALAGEIERAWSGGRVTVSVSCPNDVSLPLDRAIPVGLVVNEALTNAMKHGFPDEAHGRVGVIVTPTGADLVLRVVDDGCGREEGDLQSGMGLGLIRALGRQLGADVRFEHDAGFQVVLQLPKEAP